MQDNKPLELKNVRIDDIVFPFVQVYGLQHTMNITDHWDLYGYGEKAEVITDFTFYNVIIHLYDGQIEIDSTNKDWESIKKQVKEHIFDDHEFMQQWQERELKHD